MRVGVKKVVAEHLSVEQAHAFLGERDAVDAGGVERSQIVHGNAARTLQGQHRSLRLRPEHFGYDKIVTGGEVAAQQRSVRAFTLQIQLVGERGFDLSDDIARTNLVRRRMPTLRNLTERAQQSDVGRDFGMDPRAQHLDHDFAAIGQLRGVHLRN